MKAIKTLALLALIGLSISACKTENPSDQEESINLDELQGIWVIDTVKLGGQIRNSLNGGTFNFVNEQEFISGVNLQGTGIKIDEPTTYKIEEERIKIIGDEALIFNIEQLKDDKMILNANIRGIECVFNFSKEESAK